VEKPPINTNMRPEWPEDGRFRALFRMRADGDEKKSDFS
jgi:hypothetical protein